MKLGKFYAKLGWAMLGLLLMVSTYVSLAPETLSAAHTVRVKGINNARIVETVVPEPVVEEALEVFTPVVVEQKVVSQPVVLAKVEVVQPAKPAVQEFVIDNVISTMQVVEQSNYTNIYKTGKLYYGHNSSNLLGGLKNLNGGDKILVGSQTYTVVAKVTYLKTTLADEPGVLHPKGNLMSDVMLSAYNAENGVIYDIAVMTCAGQSYGNGDASHRLVVYANLD